MEVLTYVISSKQWTAGFPECEQNQSSFFVSTLYPFFFLFSSTFLSSLFLLFYITNKRNRFSHQKEAQINYYFIQPLLLNEEGTFQGDNNWKKQG